VQTEKFKQQLQKEKEKFYKYCDNDGSPNYKSNYCKITRKTSFNLFGRLPDYKLEYKFDRDSKDFFNQILTFLEHEIVYSNPTGDKKIPHDRFWPSSDKDDPALLLYPVKIVGYSSEYDFSNCADRPFGYWIGLKELELAQGEPIMKKDLLFLKSKPICYKSIVVYSKGRNKGACIRGIETNVQKEKK
jgi:hypothetical protein